MLSFRRIISPVKLIFTFCLIVLALLSVLSYRQNFDLIEKAMLVNHTNLVRLEAENTFSLLKDAETGTRGFMLTGDTTFLKPYEGALLKIPQSLKRLDSLVIDPKQKKNVQTLKRLSDQRLAFLNTLVSDSLSDAYLQRHLHRDRKLTEQLRFHTALMVYEEERLLRFRTESLNSAVSFAPTLNVLLAGFSILLLVFSYFKISNEIAQINRLQKQMAAANEILKKSNNELSQFAYVASHDMQEPLRKIQTLVSRIEDTETGLSEKGRDYFGRIKSSANKAQQFIKEILIYSGINQEEKNNETVDLNATLSAAKEILADEFLAKKAIVRAEKLPAVRVVKYQFEQVFVNLLSNAIKFSRPEIPPVISITAHRVKGEDIKHAAADKNLNYQYISFTDNGIGFEPQYTDRIFRIFNQLHEKEAFEGSGIGLSIVKKIMETHGGFIAAEGKPGEGAKFELYLPA